MVSVKVTPLWSNTPPPRRKWSGPAANGKRLRCGAPCQLSSKAGASVPWGIGRLAFLRWCASPAVTRKKMPACDLSDPTLLIVDLACFLHVYTVLASAFTVQRGAPGLVVVAHRAGPSHSTLPDPDRRLAAEG